MALVWRRGVPDKPGWWFVWPDEGHWLNGSTHPRVRKVAPRNTFTGGDPELCILAFPDHEHMTEAHLFRGRVAGPIQEPRDTTARVASSNRKQRASVS